MTEYLLQIGESLQAAKAALPRGGTIVVPAGYVPVEPKIVLSCAVPWVIRGAGAQLPSLWFQGGTMASLLVAGVAVESIRVVADRIPTVSIWMRRVTVTGGQDGVSIIDRSKSFLGIFQAENCVQYGNTTSGEKSQGFYCDGIRNYSLIACQFDGSLAPRNTRNHCVYGQDGVAGFVSECLFRGAASHAIQGRGTLTAYRNVFLDCPCGIKGSGWRGGELDVRENVFLGGGDIAPDQARCWGVEVKPMRNVTIENNLFAHGRTNGRNAFAVRWAPQPADEPTYPMPENETIAWGVNYVDGWPGGVRNDRGVKRPTDLRPVVGTPKWADFLAANIEPAKAARWFLDRVPN